MVFRNFAGKIIWWRVAIVVIIVLAVAYFIVMPMLFKQDSLPIGGSISEPPGFEPVKMPFSGATTSESYDCGADYCIKIATVDGELEVAYPKALGRFDESTLLTGEGVFENGRIKTASLNLLMDIPYSQ